MNIASSSQSSAKSYAAATAGTPTLSKLSKVGNAKSSDTGKKHRESKLNPNSAVFSTGDFGNFVSESSET